MWARALLLAVLLPAAPASAQWMIADEGEPVTRRAFLLPYAFWTSSTRLLGGGIYATTLPDQPWASGWVTAFASLNGTVPAYGGAQDMQLLPRLFVDPAFHLGRWGEARAYDVLFPVPDPRPGSNDSDEDLYIDDASLEWWVRVPFHYVLPIGSARETAIPTYVLRDGLLVSEPTGARGLHPGSSGVSQIRLELFARQQYFDLDRGSQSFETLGAELRLDWDNRDFRVNPSRGSRVQVAASFDPGWFSSSGHWSVWEVELSKYFDLGESRWTRQQVLALDLWTADTPTWESERLPNGTRAVSNRPPHFRGATLGGFWRLRAFPSQRFNDKAAIYYTAELRLTLRWNPIPRIRFIVEADVDWLQLVPFVEVGRVAGAWSLPELHSDLNWDVGLDLRAMVAKAVVRAGIAGGNEGVGFRAMVSHPF